MELEACAFKVLGNLTSTLTGGIDWKPEDGQVAIGTPEAEKGAIQAIAGRREGHRCAFDARVGQSDGARQYPGYRLCHRRFNDRPEVVVDAARRGSERMTEAWIGL